MHHLLLDAQAWWDAQRFDQPLWQVTEWRDQKVRHIHLHVAKALGKVVAALGEEAPTVSGPDLKAQLRDAVLPDVAIYRSQLINLFPDVWAPPTVAHRTAGVGVQEAKPLLRVVLCLSRASAQRAAYLDPREAGASSSPAHIWAAIEALHPSAEGLAAASPVAPPRAPRARLEALLGAPLPATLVPQGQDG